MMDESLAELKKELKRLQEAEREAFDTGYGSYAEQLHNVEIPEIERRIKEVE